jgi:hypothetical protein
MPSKVDERIVEVCAPAAELEPADVPVAVRIPFVDQLKIERLQIIEVVELGAEDLVEIRDLLVFLHEAGRDHP